MKSSPSKRMIRIEKKKKKMAALLEITKLNENDRNKEALQTARNGSSESSEPEPSAKRLCTKTHVNEELSQNSSDDNLSNENCLTDEIEPSVEIGPSGKPKLSGEEFSKLKKVLRENTKKIRQLTKFQLKEQGQSASISVDAESRVPLFLSDVQHLLMYSQLGHHSPYNLPRWCNLERFTKLAHTNVLIVDNISLVDYLENESSFPFLSSTFSFKLEILNPCKYNGDIVGDINMVPISSSQMKMFLSKYGTLEEAVAKSNDIFDIARNVFPVEKEDIQVNDELPQTDKFPRTHLLLSGWQMVEENFPLPIIGLMEHKYLGYVLTKDSYKDVTPFSPMFSIDCEMCKTTNDLELTRVSIVNEDLEVVYEQLVKPDNRIIDYLTKFSGITAKMMKTVTKKLEQVQEEIRQLLPDDAILVGQSLGNDLHALKMMHPYVIDTSIIFNISGDRIRKTKLKTLAHEFLNERIQHSLAGHCSIEDSSAAMKLVKLKLTKYLYFGDAVMSDVEHQIRKHPDLGHPNYCTSLLKQCTRMDKTAFLVSLEDITKQYDYYTYKNCSEKNDKKIKLVSEKSNKTVVQELCDSMMQFSLNVGHVNVTDNLDTNIVFHDLDDWIKQIYEHSAAPSLNIVIFGGKHEATNGCCFIKLKNM